MEEKTIYIVHANKQNALDDFGQYLGGNLLLGDYHTSLEEAKKEMDFWNDECLGEEIYKIFKFTFSMSVEEVQ